MLVLTRAIGQQLRLDDDITITILGKSGNQIRIGIDAPNNLDVHRTEIFERIQQQEQDDST